MLKSKNPKAATLRVLNIASLKLGFILAALSRERSGSDLDFQL
jgi:hypothetical protein